MSMIPREKLDSLTFREKIIVFGGTGACIVMVMVMIMELIYLIEG